MTTGTSVDILLRIKRLIPNRWFAWTAPMRDAILGGLSDAAAWSYGQIDYARSQTRLATAYGIWLDILCYDFLGRFLIREGLHDAPFRALIRATILQERVTRAGMINAVTILTTNVPWVFEPWNTYDTGAYSGRLDMGYAQYGSMGYGVGRGGYGNMNLPGQTFMRVWRAASSGIPGVEGYGGSVAGYGVGAIEYAGPLLNPTGVTDDIIYRLISMTKPTGSTVWTAIGAPLLGSPGYGMAKRPAILNAKNDTQNLAVI